MDCLEMTAEGGEKRAKPKRKLTERRKEQNRAAQRVFREKQRLLCQRAPEPEPEPHAEPGDPSTLVGGESSSVSAGGDDLVPSCRQRSFDLETFVLAGLSKPAGMGVVDPEDYMPIPFADSLVNEAQADDSVLQAFDMDQMLDLNLPANPDELVNPAPNFALCRCQPKNSVSSESPIMDSTFPRTDDQALESLNLAIQQGKTTIQEVLRSAKEIEVDTSSPSRWFYERFTHCRAIRYLLQASPYLADPRKNHFSMIKLNLVAACIENAVLLGVNMNELLQSHHDHTRFSSLFWQTKQQLGSLPAAQAAFVHVKPDLRPCVAQFLYGHGIYLDLFPFPTLRERIMSFRMVGPAAFDEKDFIDDLDREGLVCWGSARGSGTPWDKRSWEARPWFLKKWWMLTDGVEGELYQQSRWFCEQRGEHHDVDFDFPEPIPTQAAA